MLKAAYRIVTGFWTPIAHQTQVLPKLAFLRALPPPAQRIVADDIKYLIGWVSEAASMSTRPMPGQIVNANSTFAKVPGLTFPTDMRWLRAAHRVYAPPFWKSGYYGLALEMLDDGDKTIAIILVNRLFRLPLLFRDPLGVLTDVLTTGALLLGIRTTAVQAAARTAATLYEAARAKGVPLIFCGQSLAGGLAQYQAAATGCSRTGDGPPVGFITFNAAHVAASIEGLGGHPADVPGINFSKDRDPGVGPYSLLPNRVGVQVYIHADGSGGLTPGPSSLLSAILHPWEHFLMSFAKIDLGTILSTVLSHASRVATPVG